MGKTVTTLNDLKKQLTKVEGSLSKQKTVHFTATGKEEEKKGSDRLEKAKSALKSVVTNTPAVT